MADNDYDYSEFNYANPFELKLTGGELESLLNLLDDLWIEKQSLPSELQSVRRDLHSFLFCFHRKADATQKAEKAG